MNPNIDKLPNPELNMSGQLREMPENSDVASAQGAERLSAVEATPTAPPMQQPATQFASDATNFVTLTTQTQANTPSTGSTAARTALSARDDDETLIDKECISKAKAIVRQTSTDPFLQTKELTKIKADLLKRRYGKELKLSEE